jgi:hypothetical protein
MVGLIAIATMAAVEGVALQTSIQTQSKEQCWRYHDT